MKHFMAVALFVAATLLIVNPDEAESCGRRHRPIVPCPSAENYPNLTAEDARNALIAYLESRQRAVGPATLMNFGPNRDKLRDELRSGKFAEIDGDYYLAGFHISLTGKWYAIKLVGRGFLEDYRGEFVFEGNRWNARPPELGAIGHFKDKDGIK
jgi:hypothetical protein